MRGQLRLENGTIVREVRPLDFKHALTQLLLNGEDDLNAVAPETWDTALLSHSDLIEGELSETSKLAFIQLNSSFFASGGCRKTAPARATKLLRVEHDLNALCAALIERGHRDCWRYGWQFFLVAQEGSKNG